MNRTINKPLISVIIPLFNAQEYLDRCLETVVEQTYDNLEIILVDDKSTDFSPELCDRWAERDSRIRVIHKTVNEGQGIGRNDALKIAKGDYITFADADDYLEKDIYEKMMKTALEYDADIVNMGYFQQQADGSFKKRVIPGDAVEVRTDIADYMNQLMPGFNPGNRTWAVWTAIFRHEVCMHDFPSERKAISEDLVWTLEALDKSKTVVTIPKAGYYYIFNPDSFCRYFGADTIDRFKVTGRLIEKLEKFKDRPQIVPTFFFSQMVWLQRYCFSATAKNRMRRQGVKASLRDKEYRRLISKSSNVYRTGLKNNVWYWLNRSGNVTLTSAFAWLTMNKGKLIPGFLRKDR